MMGLFQKEYSYLHFNYISFFTLANQEKQLEYLSLVILSYSSFSERVLLYCDTNILSFVMSRQTDILTIKTNTWITDWLMYLCAMMLLQYKSFLFMKFDTQTHTKPQFFYFLISYICRLNHLALLNGLYWSYGVSVQNIE